MGKLVERVTDIPETDRDLFWNLVRVGLVMLKADHRLLDHYQRALAQAPEREQVLVYHNHPLHLAGDLANCRPEMEHYRVYREVERLAQA